MSTLITFLLSLIGKKPTVETVLSTFVKAANTLESLQTHHEIKIEKHDAKIAELQAKKAAAAEEIIAAATAVQNIRKLIGK